MILITIYFNILSKYNCLHYLYRKNIKNLLYFLLIIFIIIEGIFLKKKKYKNRVILLLKKY